ncbi:MAG TPA: pantetheine-phosphate adenylyltransferase [Verrucomicrobiales bacterium]|nr:pantetheine-phosphate adenylyltransferase [Verrucomicrobiales bacterium]
MTLGHEDLMRRAARLYDRLILAVAVGHHKRTMFTITERLEIAQEICSPYPNVEVTAFRGLLRDFVVDSGGKVVVRGLRAVSDFEFEFQLALMNRKLEPNLETLFLMPREELTYISSRLVKEIARLGGNVNQFVPPNVTAALKTKLDLP